MRQEFRRIQFMDELGQHVKELSAEESRILADLLDMDGTNSAVVHLEAYFSETSNDNTVRVVSRVCFKRSDAHGDEEGDA